MPSKISFYPYLFPWVSMQTFHRILSSFHSVFLALFCVIAEHFSHLQKVMSIFTPANCRFHLPRSLLFTHQGLETTHTSKKGNLYRLPFLVARFTRSTALIFSITHQGTENEKAMVDSSKISSWKIDNLFIQKIHTYF